MPPLYKVYYLYSSIHVISMYVNFIRYKIYVYIYSIQYVYIYTVGEKNKGTGSGNMY